MSSPERGPVEIRSAALDEVDYPDRTISMVLVPFDEWTPVEYQGRVIEESLAPGSFGAVAMRARKFLVNMEHDRDRWVGTVLDLRSDDRGLRADLKIRRTAEGDQALNDAADGLLGGSIGMAVAPRDQTWTEDRSRRRIVKAFLDHVALTATPAYLGAEVVDVRSGLRVVKASTSATPRLDEILAARRAEAYDPA